MAGFYETFYNLFLSIYHRESELKELEDSEMLDLINNITIRSSYEPDDLLEIYKVFDSILVIYNKSISRPFIVNDKIIYNSKPTNISIFTITPDTNSLDLIKILYGTYVKPFSVYNDYQSTLSVIANKEISLCCLFLKFVEDELYLDNLDKVTEYLELCKCEDSLLSSFKRMYRIYTSYKDKEELTITTLLDHGLIVELADNILADIDGDKNAK